MAASKASCWGPGASRGATPLASGAMTRCRKREGGAAISAGCSLQSCFPPGTDGMWKNKTWCWICSLLPHKREPERTAVPGGHESPSGAFKPQTGLRSKCCVFSAARSRRFRRAGPTRKGLLAPFRSQRRSRNGKMLAASLNAFFAFLRFQVAARRSQDRQQQMQFPVTTPSCEKVNWKNPQIFPIYRIINKISAEYGQSECGGHSKSF